MIVKNESAIIERCLRSVTPFISYYCITDTGSTDNTKAIIKDYFDSVGIPGEINDFYGQTKYEINYSAWRNHALDRLVASKKVKYGLIIDADETLHIGSIPHFEQKDYHWITCKNGSSEWPRLALFRLDKGFRWIRPVHNKFVTSAKHLSSGTIPKDKLFIEVKNEGHSWTRETAKEKYLRNANILIEWMKDEKQEDPHTIFYIAQCFYDAGEKQMAYEWYNRRAKIKDNYLEQQYVAQYYCGVISEDQKHIEFLYEYLKCSNIMPQRGEHLLKIIQAFQKGGDYETSYIFSRSAIQTHHGIQPKGCVLFVDVDCYNFKLMQAHILNCKKTGRKN